MESEINSEKIMPPDEVMQPHEQVINPQSKLLGKKYHLKQFFAGIISVFIVILIGATGYYLGRINKPEIQPTVSPTQYPQPTAIVITAPIIVPTTDLPKETNNASVLGDPMDTKAGKVTLTTDKTAYKRQKEAIYVTVANGLTQPIYAEDEQTNCSIVSLQYLEESDWKSIDDCFLGRLPGIITTGSKHGRVIKLQTKPLPPIPENDPNMFKPGLYRITFAYSLSINGPQFGGELIRPLTIYSAPFSIEQ